MEDKSITVNGVNISYRSEGVGAPVLLIHGNTGSNLWYEKVMNIEGLRTVAPDMPNFGDSGHIDTADIDLYAEYIRDFIAEMQIDTPVPVVGHSLGGCVAISLALRNPQLVSKLMLVDSAPLNGLHTPEEHYPIIEQYKSNKELLTQALQAVTPTMDDPDFLSRLADEAMKMNPLAFEGNARALDRFDYSGNGSRYGGPVLVCVGDHDVLITKEMAQETVDAFPNSELKILEGVGHSVMVEDPGRFTSLLREFFLR